MSRSIRHAFVLGTPLLLASPQTLSATNELSELKQQLAKLQQKIEQIESQQATQAQSEKSQSGIKVGGAIRVNYATNSYDEDAKNRGGDFDFDVFRFNFSGEVANIGLNAEIRFFDYMNVVKYAYLDYDVTSQWQAQLGLTQVPFGNDPYNSHSFFMSPNYFVGLEDDYDMGIVMKRRVADNWQLDLGFFKNDELGGIDGYVEDRKDRYSIDIVGIRGQKEGIYDAPEVQLGEQNTFVGRYHYHLEHFAGSTAFGISALRGGLHDGQYSAGDYQAWAIHVNSHVGNWNVQLQHGQYDYQLTNVERIAIAANATYDTMPAKATMSSANIAYNWSVNYGPVTHLQLYNDFGTLYNKSDNSANTWMNVTGVALTAGPIFSYIDLVHAKNQPFVGGTIAGQSEDVERRFNINIGYYF
ncbi:FlxA-like family protein [Pseudoalteromonas sp. SMS1]|uniref:FlxA-like family protein n=1 Tax=Pseudoalteromonas sp. SMS1 TaxID=2908894 RepID=UPI001F33909C|nr:FlxA-like family protein [Pseudoalteromonas sp. SMS1]MCF2859733.1 FlxA-like family protein [Pseudoalteromonas sp. SMS1]